DQRDRHPFLFALLRPTTAGGGAARRGRAGDWTARGVRRLSARGAGDPDARPELEVILLNAVRAFGPKHRVRLRAKRRGNRAAIVTLAKRGGHPETAACARGPIGAITDLEDRR